MSDVSIAPKLNEAFARYLSFDKEHIGLFGLMPSSLKVFLYRLFGARIGKNVRIPKGTYLLCQRLSVGDDTEFGKHSLFQIFDFAIGDNAKFEPNVHWRCRKIVIGHMLYCSAGAKVGWGGEFDDEAQLVIGDCSFIGEEAMLNPARPITIGNRTAIGAGVKVYTHQFWQSVLDGYEARFLPVTIEDYVMIGCNAAILPGALIKKGSTVAANSTVAGVVREKALVGGIPAVELPSSKIYPRQLMDKDRETLLNNIFQSFLNKRGLRHQKEYAFRFSLDGIESLSKEARQRRTIVLAYYCKDKRSLEKYPHHWTVFVCSDNTVIGEQDTLSDELREFLRKQGIVFSPIRWRYKRPRRK